MTDGADAPRPVLTPVLAPGGTAVRRLRGDAAWGSLPAVVPAGQRGRGRPRSDGTDRIDLAQGGGPNRGGPTATVTRDGRPVVKTDPTLRATSKPVGGAPRGVGVRAPDRGVASFATDPAARGASLRGAGADRGAREPGSPDVPGVQGAGQPQWRPVGATGGAGDLLGGWPPVVALRAWDRPPGSADRSDSPWDEAERRPSPADRGRGRRREAREQDYARLPSGAGRRPKIRRFVPGLMPRVA